MGWIKVELAGMRSDDLEITVEGNRLRICGQRPDVCRTAKCSFWVMEIDYGPFERLVELPSGYDLSQAAEDGGWGVGIVTTVTDEFPSAPQHHRH